MTGSETLAVLGALGALLLFAPRANASTSRALNLIREVEELSLVPYQDQGGTWHVGWGHKLNSRPSHDRITRQQAERYLREDARKAINAVARLVKVKLTDNERAALTSFVYNVGSGAFADSTLLAKLNRGNKQGAADEFRKWVYVKGDRSAGLQTRREAERRVFVA